MMPAPSAAAMRSNRFATVRPIIPSPRNSEIPSGSHVPKRALDLGERQPEQQAEQQADEQAEHRGHELGRRELLDALDEPAGRDDREVREHGEADDHPGDRPGRKDEAGVVPAGEQPGPGCRQPETDEGSERRTEDPDRPNHASP